MTGKQRALCALRGEATDRPSVLPSIDVVYAAHCSGHRAGECFCDATLHANALMKALDKHPEIDGLYVNLCLTQDHVQKTGDNCYVDAGGMQWYVPDDDVGTVRAHDITALTDVRIATKIPLQHGIVQAFAAIDPAYKEKYLIIPGITGPYSQLVFMLGLEPVLMLMYDEPEALKVALAQRAALTLQWVSALRALGAQAVWLGEGAASASIISPAAYAEFVGPYAKQIVTAVQQAGMQCVMHVCGNINPSLKEIFATGVTAIDIDYPVPLARARQVGGSAVCLKGNLNPVTLLQASEEAVLHMSQEVLRNTQTPFILSTGCLVARDTPPQNIDAMVQAAKTL